MDSHLNKNKLQKIQLDVIDTHEDQDKVDPEQDTKVFVDKMRSGQNNILVAVRARPLNSKELAISNYDTVRVIDDKIVVLSDPQSEFEVNDVLRANRNRDKQYAFDFAFDQQCDTDTVFQKCTKFLIPGVLNGFNATVFAYGATGAGKTHTMLGSAKSSGIMNMTMQELFDEIARMTDKNHAIKISYLEVYNETLRDLLSTEENIMDIREDAERGIVVAGITEIPALKVEDVLSLLRVGSKNRTMEPTGANVVSSRSHAVLQVIVEQSDKTHGVNQEIIHSKLSMIDLAGSERAANTNNSGQRMIEGANINRSLLALGNCINMLSEKNDGSKNIQHIPYRQSKLTRLLKDSLGGNCRTVMIANICGAATCFEDTHNTLKYANRAKNIKTVSLRNTLKVASHLKKYNQIIEDLKNENEHLKKLLQKNSADLVSVSSITKLKNEELASEIKKHFDEENKLLEYIYDLEDNLDINQEKMSKLESDINDDVQSMKKFEEYSANNLKLITMLKEAKHKLKSKTDERSVIIKKIQAEDDSQTYINTMKQYQMIFDNNELTLKEKRAENKMKSKDRQIEYLKSQLAHQSKIFLTPRLVGKPKKLDSNDNLKFGNDNDRTIEDLEKELSNQLKKERKNSALANLEKKHLSSVGRNHHTTPVRAKKVMKSEDEMLLQRLKVQQLPPKLYFNKEKYLQEKTKPFDPRSKLLGGIAHRHGSVEPISKINHIKKSDDFKGKPLQSKLTQDYNRSTDLNTNEKNHHLSDEGDRSTSSDNTKNVKTSKKNLLSLNQRIVKKAQIIEKFRQSPYMSHLKNNALDEAVSKKIHDNHIEIKKDDSILEEKIFD